LNELIGSSELNDGMVKGGVEDGLALGSSSEESPDFLEKERRFTDLAGAREEEGAGRFQAISPEV